MPNGVSHHLVTDTNRRFFELEITNKYTKKRQGVVPTPVASEG